MTQFRRSLILTCAVLVGLFTAPHVVQAQFITNQTVTTGLPAVCPAGSTQVTLGGSEIGISYTLRDRADMKELDGPKSGTGGALTFNTGALSANTRVYVLASKEESESYGSITFRNNGDYAAMGETFNSLFNIGTKVSLEAWVYRTGTEAIQTIAGSFNSTNTRFKLTIENGKPKYYVTGYDIGTGIVTGSTTIQQGVWTHIAGVYDGISLKVYVNGVVDGTSLYNAEMYPYTGTPFVIGSTELGKGFSGKISDVRVWLAARTAAEIASNMNSCLTGAEPGLLAYYKMISGAGKAFTDYTNNGYNGLANFDIDALGAWGQGPNGLYGCTRTKVMTDSPTINVIEDKNVYAQQSSFCGASGSTNVITEFTQSGVNYTLKNDADGSVISGPTAGTGASLSLPTGTISSTTKFYVEASALDGSCSVVMSKKPVVNNDVLSGNFNVTTDVSSGTCNATFVTSLAGSVKDAYYTLKSGSKVLNNVRGTGNPVSFPATTVTSNTTLTVESSDGLASNSCNFDGTGYLTVNDLGATSLDLNSTFTIESWVYPTDAANNTIVDKGNYGYLFQTHSNNRKALGLLIRGTWTYSAGSVPINTWSHVAVTYDKPNDEIRFYLNGKLLSVHNNIPAMVLDDDPLTIGNQALTSCNCNRFNGKMADLRLWNTVRSISDIAGKKDDALSGSETGLAAYFRFDDGAGSTTIKDRTSNQYVGTSSGSITFESSFPFFGRKACTFPLTASPTITITPIPTQNITASATSGVCMLSPLIGINGSVVGVNYYLKSVTSGNILAGPVAGTGNAVSFPMNTFKSTQAVAAVGTQTDAYLIFDGINDYAETDSSVKLLANTSFSVEFWAKRSNTTGNQILFSAGSALQNNGLSAGWQGDNLVFSFFNNDLTASNLVVGTDWKHYAFTYNATTKARTIYLNGTLVATDVSTSDYLGTGAVRLARDLGTGSSYFSGGMDEFRVWDHELQTIEIISNMNTQLPANTSGLRLYFNLNEQLGLRAMDLTSNYNHLSLKNLNSNFCWQARNGVLCSTTGGSQSITVSNFGNFALGSNTPTTICTSGTTSTVLRVTSSVVGSSFQLRDDATGSLIGSPVVAAAATTNFPGFPVSSTRVFNVLATNAAGTCSSQLVAKVTVAVPSTELALSYNAAVCAGSAGVVTVKGSQNAISYSLENDATGASASSSVSGNTGDINLTTTAVISSTNTYKIRASRTGCVYYLTQKATLSPTTLTNKSVTATASTIPSGDSTTIVVGASENGVVYKLLKDADNSLVDGPKTGTGSDLSFNTGKLTASRTFNVLASATGGCSVTMTNKPRVNVGSPGTISNVTFLSGDVCPSSGNYLSWTYSGITADESNGNAFHIYLSDNTGAFTNATDMGPVGNNFFNNDGAGSVSKYLNNVKPGAYKVKVVYTSNPTIFGVSDAFTVSVPAVSAGPDTTVNKNSMLTLKGTAPTATSFSWDEGAAITANYTFQVTQTGNHILTVYDSRDCMNSDTVKVTLSPNSAPTISTAAKQSFCSSETPSSKSVGFTISDEAVNDVQLAASSSNTDLITNASLTAGGSAGDRTISVIPVAGKSGSATITVTATDQAGLTASSTFAVYVNAKVSASGTAKNVSCKSLSDGSAEVSATGGSGTLSYTWTGSTNTTNKLTGLIAGTYSCKISDDSSCTADVSVTVTQPDTLVAGGSSTNISCYGSANGIVNASHTGGTAPYTYSWTNSTSGSNELSGLSPNTYEFKVLDANKCSSSKSFTITQPDSLYITGTTIPVNCFGASNGAFKATVKGGTEPYSFKLNGSVSNVPGAANVSAGTYTLSVCDKNGCKKEASFVVGTPDEIVITEQPENAAACNTFETSFKMVATGGKSYQWQAKIGNGFQNISESNTSYSGSKTNTLKVKATNGLNNTIYRCLVSQSETCYKLTDEVKLIVNATPTAPKIAYIAPLCQNAPEFQLNQGSPAGGVFSIDGQEITVFNPGSYIPGSYLLTYTITSEFGCKNSTFQNLTVKAVPEVSFETPADVCEGADAFALTGGSPDGGKYSGEYVTDGNIRPALAGVFKLTYTYTNSAKCTGMAYSAIKVLSSPKPRMPKPQFVCANAAAFNFGKIFGKAEYTYSFSGEGVEGTTFDPSKVSAGDHYVKVLTLSSNGCFSVDSFLVVVKAKPTVTFDSPGSVCSNAGNTALLASPAGGTFFGEGITNGSFNAENLKEGVYSLSYAYTAENFCSDTARTTVKVKAFPKVDVASSSTIFCEGDNVTLKAGSFSGYQWYYEGEKIVGQTSAQLVAKSAGEYYVAVKAENGCKGNSYVVKLSTETIEKPVITYQGSPNFCQHSSIKLSAGVYATYQWYKNGDPIVGANSQSYDADDAGAYSVQVSNGNCQSTSIELNVAGYQGVVIEANRSTTLCEGEEITFATGSAKTYQWYKDGGEIADAISASFKTGEKGKYSVAVSDNNGCSVTSSEIEVVVNPLPMPVIYAAGDTSFCPGGSVVLSTYGTFETYKWKKGQSDVIGGRFQKLEASKTGLFKVMVSNEYGCFAVSNEIEVTEKSAPSTGLTNKGIQYLCEGDTFVASSVEPGIIYQWMKGNQPIVGETNQSISLTEGGSFRVDVENGEGCKSLSESVTIFMKAAPVVPEISFTDSSLTATEAQNYQWYKDGVKLEGETSQSLKIFWNGLYTVEVVGENGCNTFANDFVVSNLSIESNDMTKAAIAPNPVQNLMNIDVRESGSYKLFDINGKVISVGTLSVGKNVVSTSELAAGVYQLRITSGSKEEFVRIVK